MSYGQPSWIAVHLLGPDLAGSVREVRSESVWFGSTAGPFGGIGGAAMSQFQMTLVVAGEQVFVFADETLWGWAPASVAGAVVEAWVEGVRGSVGVLRGLLETAESCPATLPGH